MASISKLLATLVVAGLTAGGALAQTPQVTLPGSVDTTAPGTGAADLPHGPIVNGRQLQPRAGQPPSKQEANQVDRLVKSTPPDAVANGPIVQPHDLFGNPLGGSPGLDPKKP
ncbi:MAG: hypothetical protein JWO51_2191 [Rhodospirillales bacterium]|nr:hypothetical protein [Rhodospirillales bacterium]